MVYQLNKSIFSSNQDHFCQQSTVNNGGNEEELSKKELETLLHFNDGNVTKSLLRKLFNTLQGGNNEIKEMVLTVGFQLIHNLMPLLSTPDKDRAYLSLQLLADQLDHDELVENMMDQLICMSWEYTDVKQCLNMTQLYSVYIELFGRGLEKMTKARDWMLFLPFLANSFVRAIDLIETILTTERSTMYSSHAGATSPNPTGWDPIVILLTHTCLDYIEFIHSRTVSQEPADFPITTNDIGTENGDTKRRYLGYFLLNLIYKKVISNFDMQLSKIYFEKFHAVYNIKRLATSSHHEQPNNLLHIKDENYKPMFNIIHRCANLAFSSGFTFHRMYQLLNSINEKDHYAISLEDRLSDDDRQMINSRLYPLTYNGIAALLSLSLYDKLIYPFSFNTTSSVGLFSSSYDTEMFSFAKKYIGIVLNLLLRPSEMICQADKGVFVLLYLSDEIKTNAVTIDDMEKYIQGPCGNELVIPAARIIEIISSVASTCPDPSIRFLSYKLVEKFLNFGNDETKVFFLIELLDRCPFPSMKTAAIGLLKDQIDCSFKQVENEKIISIFTSPFIITKFFPIIFKSKSGWKENDHTLFWDDYNYIVQALNIYFYLLLKDSEKNLTTVWNVEHLKSMSNSYIKPLLDLIQNIKPNKDIQFQDMQIHIMKDVIDKITSKIQEKNM